MTSSRQQRSPAVFTGRGAFGALFGGALLLAGCSVDLPPRLPSTAIHDRTASRVDLVDFVIADRARANAVRALYIEVEELMLGAQQVIAREQAKLGGVRFQNDAEAHASLAASRDAELGALERYVAIQMAIRRLTTPEEFARLDSIK